ERKVGRIGAGVQIALIVVAGGARRTRRRPSFMGARNGAPLRLGLCRAQRLVLVEIVVAVAVVVNVEAAGEIAASPTRWGGARFARRRRQFAHAGQVARGAKVPIAGLAGRLAAVLLGGGRARRRDPPIVRTAQLADAVLPALLLAQQPVDLV